MFEKKSGSSIKSLIHLDPRTKLLLLVFFSVIVMIDVSNGPAYIVRVIMTFIPVVLLSLEGKPHIGAWFTVLFISASVLMKFIGSDRIPSTLGMLILFYCTLVMQFAPTMIMVWYVFSTTKVSEFLAAMNRMHCPKGFTISLAVIMRFFPTLAEEYGYIRDAMRMRGIQFGKGRITKMVNYRIIPLLFSSLTIGDELSAAAVTRGLGKPVKRTNVCKIGFGVSDYMVIFAAIGLTVLFVYLSFNNRMVVI